MPEPLRQKLDAWAKDEGITRSEAIRRLVEHGLAVTGPEHGQSARRVARLVKHKPVEKSE